ncbi:DUF2848 family protein [Actinacidiphila soli]|uniref:DUF2848 family protein n=1 Tax=Actinacidiphila soli TaxID=2487275 RepID=UPI001F0BCEB4|nr:DUF2848 family protein [Actinacidiphila soli]
MPDRSAAVDEQAVLDELYGLRPDRFTAARTRHATRARQAGDRELGARLTALRRPTLAAWASNQLVRAHPEQVAPILRLERYAAERLIDLGTAPVAEPADIRQQQHALRGAEQVKEFIAKERGEFVPGTLLISGTIPMAEGIDQFADRWRVELADPTSGASIELAYDVVPLPAPIG